MNNGDVTVCGVSEDKLVEDIGILVPKGDGVLISGALAHQSKDLWRLLSQGVIFQLNANSKLVFRPAKETIPQPQVIVEELGRSDREVETLRLELSKFRSENSTLRAENKQLQADVSRLRAELNTQTLNQSKLDDILNLVKSRPAATEPKANGLKMLHVSDVDESVPIFIPSQIKGESVEGHVSLKEEASDAGSLSDASKALKGMRRKNAQ